MQPMNYEQALAGSNYTIFATPLNRIDTYRCIANSYQLAGATEKAIDALKRCAGEFPTEAGKFNLWVRENQPPPLENLNLWRLGTIRYVHNCAKQ